MSMDSQNWYRVKHNPQYDKLYGDRLFYFELGGEVGFYPHDRNDNILWYRLHCSYWFGDWIETQERDAWIPYSGHHRAIYHVREDLMTLIRLKWL